MGFLGLIDVAGIQRYIFRQPDLKSIASSSRFIESLSKPGGLLRETTSPVNLIFAAGGNAAYWSSTAEPLKELFAQISRVLLCESDGLEVVATIGAFDPGKLAFAYVGALRNLEQQKLTRQGNVFFMLPGLQRPVKEPPGASLDTYRELQLPLQFDNVICESGREKSDLMAVTSLDGLSMGKRLIDWLVRRAEADDETFCKELSNWSDSLKTRWEQAWFKTLDRIADQFGESGQFQHEYLAGRPLGLPRDREGRPCFPCRRIYQGGDDMSFVCDARLALAITADLIERLEVPAEGVPVEFRQITVSAGIIYVDSHYPFARGIRLSNLVRRDAKARALGLKESVGLKYPPSTLDWWINRQGGLARPEGKDAEARLHPYALHGEVPSGGRTWQDIEGSVLPGLWRLFSNSRNKLKDLMAAVEEDDDGAGVKRLLATRPLHNDGGVIEEPFAFLGAPYDPKTGFSPGRKTPLPDAAELYDLHYPFVEPAASATGNAAAPRI